MVNSGSFDAAGSEGESAKAEFTQLEDGDADAAPRSAASPRHLTDFAAVVPDTNQPSPSAASERDDGLTTPPQATMTTLNTASCPPATPTKASLQCSVPLDKVKNVLEMCRQSQTQSQSPVDKSKFNNFFILENYLKQKQKTNELTTPSTEKTDTESTTSSSNSGESSKPTLKRLLCLFCDRTFTSNNLKQKHVDRCHSAGQTRRSSSRTSSQNQSATACCFCSKLNQTEHTLKELFEHLINEHSNRYYACLSCQERFTSLQSLRDHNKSVHGIEDAPVSDNKTLSLSVVSSDTAASDVSDSSINVDLIKRTKSDVAKSEAQTKSSPTASSGKPLKRNSSLKSNENTETKEEQRESSKSVGFHVDFEDSILANIINPEDIKKSKENEDSNDTISTRKSRSSASNSKNKQNPSSSSTITSSSSSPASNQTSTRKNSSNVSNKKISVKSTKNGVRNLRTTRASVKQLNNFNKTRKSKVKSDSEPVQPEPIQKSMCNPASVFSLVNAYIYKYEKIYDHASDSIKDANSVQFNAVFDREFYLRTVCNIRENLLNHLDGKLNRNIESETRISHFEHNPALAEAKSAKDVDNFGCDLSLNALTPVATLLASSQYGEDFDAQIEYGAKASQKKPKKVAVVKYKFPNKKYNSLFRERDGHTDLTSLDMWTQLTVKNRQSKVHDDGSFDSDSPFFDRSSGFEAKHLVDELNSILDKRGPFEDLLMEANAAQFLELRKKSNKDGDYISEEASKDVYFILDEILNRVVSECNETDIKIESQQHQTETLDNVKEDNLEIPHYFQLQRSPNTNSIKIDKTDTIALICSSKDENDKSDKRLELTGEWTRPRIYICAACGLKLPNLKSLADHKNNDHPHIWCSHYEFVGNQSQFYRHLSIPGLGKVSVIESQPQNRVWQKSDARVCSKCTKQCHNLGELHKHILECGGDWTWMLARKKCKYRPYGARTRRRRQRGYKRTCNPEVSRTRELKPKNKPNFIGPRPKPSKPSDAETIERMLANLPPKRNRKMISMRDGIQRPRKPYKQSPNSSSSHLNISQKPPSKHFKNNSPQITKQTLRSALKRKLAMNNLRKQNGNDNQDNVSVKLRSRMKNEERDDTKNKDTEPLSTKTKLRNKRMISRILGSKIFDSNTAIVTRRRLVKAITQNNLMRKTRLRTKMLEANALKLEAQAQKEEPIVETETSAKVSVKSKVQQEVLKENKRKEENSAKMVKSESSTKTVKPDKLNLENSTIDKPAKKSNSKRLLSVLTKSSKKPKVIVEDNPDTVSAVINDVVNMAHKEEITLEKSESLEKIVDGVKVGLRRTRSSNKFDFTSSDETKTESIIKENVIPTPEMKTDKPIDNKADNKEIKKIDNFGKAFSKRTSKLMQNVKSFRKNIKQTNENKTDSKNESIASKLIRTFSIRGSKRKKTNKADDTDKSSVISFENVSTVSEEPPKDEFKKTTIDNLPNIINEVKEAENPQILKNTETSKTIESEMPVLEKNNPLPEKQICDPIVLPVLSSVTAEKEKSNTELKTDNAFVDTNETDFKQSDEKLNAPSGTLNKFKSKMKRSGRGLNDCIAMLKCKLEQKTVEPPLVDKSNLFILNSLELNKHSLVSECSQINAEESTKFVLNEETSKNIEHSIPKTPTLENINSQDAIDLSMVSRPETLTLKNILEVPILKGGDNKLNSMQKKELIVEVSTVEIQTQTFEEDIAPALPEYLPHIQSNIQLSSLLNATLKNCLMECVKNKCEELKNDTQILRKSSTKDRKIGSVRKRRTAKTKPSEAVEKPPLNIPLLLNTAFTEKSQVKSKLGSTNSPRTTTAEDTSEDDLPLSKLVSSSSVESKLKVKLSVAKKKRSAKKQIAFTPLILNSPDTCIPQISFQERLEQRISLDNPAAIKNEATSIKEEDKTTSKPIKIEDSKKQIQSNVPNYIEKNSPVKETTEISNANCLSKEAIIQPVEENLSTKEPLTESSINPAVSEITATSNQVEVENKSSNNEIQTNQESTEHKEIVVASLENHPPLSEQIMLVEDEPLINYLVNKTLTETNVKPASSVKNAIPTENIELINKLDCIDSGKENSDIQGIKKQKKTVKKSRGKRKSRGKLNATDSQIDYSTSLEATEKIKTSAESNAITTNDDAKEESESAELYCKVKDDFNETEISISETKETDTLLEQSEECNEDLKKKLKSPKKTADVASIIEAIEAAIQSSIKIQDEIDNKNKINEKTFPDTFVVNQKKKRASRQKLEEDSLKINNPSIINDESNLDDESSLVSEESKEKISEKDENVVRRRSRTKSKVNSESESVTPEEPTKEEENEEKIISKSLKLDEISVVKKRRGRAKKVVEEIKVTNSDNYVSLENLDKTLLNEEQPEIKRTTRTKPKVNYEETEILYTEVESMSEESNDQSKILDNNELNPDNSEITENVLQTEDYEKKRATRGKKMNYSETDIPSDSEASVNKIDKSEILVETNNETQVISEEIEKEKEKSVPLTSAGNNLHEEKPEAQLISEINTNEKEDVRNIQIINDEDIVTKIEGVKKNPRIRNKNRNNDNNGTLKTVNQSKLEPGVVEKIESEITNNVEKAEDIPIQVKSKRGRKPKNKNKINKIEMEPVVTSIIEKKILETGPNTNNLELNKDLSDELNVQSASSENTELTSVSDVISLVLGASAIENDTLKTSSVVQEIFKEKSNANIIAKSEILLDENIENIERKRRSRGKSKLIKETAAAEFKTSTNIIEEEKSLIAETPTKVEQNETKRRRSCMKIKLNYQEAADEVESDESSNTGLDSVNEETPLEETKVKRRSRSKKSSTTSETEEVPESNTSSAIVPQSNKYESFLHPEEIKPRRISRTKLVSPILETQSTKFSNLELMSSMSSDDSSNTLEETKPKRRSRTRKMLPKQGTDIESNSELDIASSMNSNESFINPDETKIKRRFRGKNATNLEIDNESMSSLNSDESSTNPDEIKLKRKSYSSSIAYNHESDIPESKSVMETVFSVFNTESSNLLETKTRRKSSTNIFANQEPGNIESNTDSETVSSNELNTSVEVKKIKRSSRKKQSIDNIVSRLTETVKHDESYINEVKQNSQSKITLTIPLKNVQSKIDTETTSEVNSEDTTEKQQPRLKITIANQKIENQTNAEVESLRLEAKSKRKFRSKISVDNKKIDNVEHKADSDMLSKENNFNFNLSFENIKNKLKSRLEETENVEPNVTLEDTSPLTENMSLTSSYNTDNSKNKKKSCLKMSLFDQNTDVSNSVSESVFNEEILNSEGNEIRAPKLKITLVNPETEKIETESITNSIENKPEITENKEKNKRRSFIKIKLNLPPEPEINDISVPADTENIIEPEISTEVLNESLGDVEIKKKKRYRKKELELLGAATIENHLPEYKNQITDTNNETFSDNIQNISKPESVVNRDIITVLSSEEKIENTNIQIENVSKLSEEILIIKPEPKKRGRKPKNAKKNAALDSSNPESSIEISIPTLDTSDFQQLEIEHENCINIENQQPLETDGILTELEESIAESERKSRRSRPKINYQEIENDESTDLSSDSELSIKENTQNEHAIITNEIPIANTNSNTLEELNSLEKEIKIDSEMNTAIPENVNFVKDSLITVEQLHKDDQIQKTTSSIPVFETTDEIINETKPKKKRGRKKASIVIDENEEEKGIDSIEPQQLEQQAETQIPAIIQNVVTPKPRGRGRPSTKQKQETQNHVSVVENLVTSTTDLDEIDAVTLTVNEISEEFKRKSRCKINYQELENSTSVDSISDLEVKTSEEINLQHVVINTDEIVSPHVPKKRGRKPKRKNINRQEPQISVVSEPVENHILPERILTAEEPINEEVEYNKKRSRSNSIADEIVVPQITELKKTQEEQLPILKLDMKKRRQQIFENQFETETNLEEFNKIDNISPVSCDEAPVHKIKKKRRSRSKNSETMSQQNIASAIELLTNVENTIESLKEFTKDKPLTNNFKNQLQENIEYEPESIMECKDIQDLTSAPSLNVTVAISPAAIASDSEDELPLSILVKSKPDADTEGILDSIPEINTVNETSLISENSLLDINVDEINFTKAENKLILSTHNSFDFDDDNIIDQEELSQLVDITSETLLENIEDDYISTIDTAAVVAKDIVADKILDEIKQVGDTADENVLDEIIEDLEIVTKCIPLKTDSNIVSPEILDDNLASIDKSAEDLLNLIGAEEESDFITTPDLKDTSLIIKIKKNFNVHIRKAKKGRRRVIPKSLNRNNIRRREEEDAVCEICNKSFKRKETLASHKKTLTHIAKLSEIEARENQAKRLSESENVAEINKEIEKANEIEEDGIELNKENAEASKEIPEIKRSDEIHEILNADDSSCENVDLNDEIEKTDVPEIVNVAPQKPMNNILPGLIVNSTNSTLKLIDIINEVLDKPVSDLNLDNKGYSPQSIRKSPTSCDSTETFSEPKRYKSLGERKSFDSDSYTMTPKSNEEAKPENFNTIKPITNGEILCKQLSILENIIEETSPSLNNYIDDSVSLSSSQFEEPLPEPNISDKDIDYTKFSHTADVLSSLIKPNHFNNFENISDSFTKPMKQQEAPEHSHQEEEKIKNKEIKDNSTRKILNRDEELFLECCSLLKSGSEISGSKKSTKQIQLNSFSRSNDAGWIMQKQQNSDRFIQRDSYSWLAQSSRVETPIGEPFVNNDWSNSNSAVSSEWLAQKAPSPDRPTESNTILKKSNNNSEESKYTDLRFEDISIDSSLETSKTLMAVEHSNTENVPLDFHNVDFANSNLQQQTPKHQNEELSSHQAEEEEITPNPEKEKPIEQNEDTSSREEFDAELKKKVVSAFGGLMAKALNNRLHAVVKKTKKSKGKRDLEGAIQSSITDYAIPVKKNKPNHQTDSDSSDCPKKLITKGAMKVFEGIKVSIPTQDLNLKEVLNKTKKTEVEVNAEKLEAKEFEPVNEKEELVNKNGKLKHLFGRFGNKLGLREKKKKTIKRRSPKSQNTISKSVDDVYEFEESQDKSTFSLFKHSKENHADQTTIIASKNEIVENEAEKWSAESESDTDRYYDSMSFEEQSLSSESTPESTTPVKMKPVIKKATEKTKDNQKKCMIMGRIFKNASKPKLEDKIPEIRDFTSEENSKVVENYLDSCSSGENVENGIVEQPPPEVPNVPNNSAVTANSTNKMSKKEMDMLFDKLLEEEMKMHEKEKLLAKEANTEKEIQNEDVFSKPLAIDKTQAEKKKSKDNIRTKVVAKPKKRQRHNSDSTSSDEFRLGGRQSKSTKKPKTHRKPTKPKKESGINLEQEMKECIGVAGRKSQRKCTSGKQNVLVEFWSSDESSFEEVLNLIEKQNESKPIEEHHVNEEEEEVAIEQTNDVSVNNSIDSKEDSSKKPSLDIYDFESDAESKIEEFHPKPKPEDAANQQQSLDDEDSELFLAVNKMKIPKRIPKPKRNRKHSRNHDDESASEYEAEKTRRRNEHRRKKMLEHDEIGEGADVGADCLAVSRRKRNAGDQLYYWSSSSDDEMQDLIEVKPIREDTDDDRPMHHGWIVGDSPKKLVTMLAQAKGKKIDGESVKEQGKKNRVTL